VSYARRTESSATPLREPQNSQGQVNCAVIFIFYIFLSVAQQPNSGLGRLSVDVSRSHTDTHTLGRTPLNEWSARRRGRYLHNTKQTQETNIHDFSGIRTRDPSNQAASDLRLRPQGHRDRRLLSMHVANNGSLYYHRHVITFKSGTKMKRVNLDMWHPVEFSSITLRILSTHSTQLGS
jgi:hypothetical protein